MIKSQDLVINYYFCSLFLSLFINNSYTYKLLLSVKKLNNFIF